MGYRCDVVGGVEIKRRTVKDISKICLGPGRAGPSSPSDCPSNHTPCAQGHWPLAVPFISQSVRTCCSLPPRPRQASFAPSLHLHFGSNAPSSSRSSGGLISRNHYRHLLACALPVLHRLTPAYISIYVSVVFIFLESEPHESQFLVCVVHSSNTGPQSAGPSRHSRIRC